MPKYDDFNLDLQNTNVESSSSPIQTTTSAIACPTITFVTNFNCSNNVVCLITKGCK